MDIFMGRPEGVACGSIAHSSLISCNELDYKKGTKVLMMEKRIP